MNKPFKFLAHSVRAKKMVQSTTRKEQRKRQREEDAAWCERRLQLSSSKGCNAQGN